MNLNLYTLCVIYLVYSFLGWVGETVVATAKGRRFTNRGVASGPVCFVYGTAGVLITIGLNDQRTSLAALFFGSMIYATVVEWLTAKLLERIHHRRWWDYSDKKFNLDGYVCLQYSLLWGLLGMAAVRWGNDLLFRLCAHLPPLLFHAVVWGGMALAVLDQISAMVVVSRYANRHPRLEQLNRELGRGSERLRQKITASVEKRIQRAYPAAARPEPTTSAEKQLSLADLLWLFVIGAFLGDVVETIFCRITAGVWMSRSSLVWGPFSVVWGLALVLASILLRGGEQKSESRIFCFGVILGGAYEYVQRCDRAAVWHCVLGLQRLQVQSGRAHQPAVLLLLGHCGRDLDPLWLPTGGKGDEGGQAQDPPLDDRSAGRGHGREPCDPCAGAGPLRCPHQRRGSGQCGGCAAG